MTQILISPHAQAIQNDIEDLLTIFNDEGLSFNDQAAFEKEAVPLLKMVIDKRNWKLAAALSIILCG